MITKKIKEEMAKGESGVVDSVEEKPTKAAPKKRKAPADSEEGKGKGKKAKVDLAVKPEGEGNGDDGDDYL